jgi:hypothetical protein
MAPAGVEPAHADSKSAALSAELRGPKVSVSADTQPPRRRRAAASQPRRTTAIVPVRGRGGTGRRGGFRTRWAKALGGSSPLARISGRALEAWKRCSEALRAPAPRGLRKSGLDLGRVESLHLDELVAGRATGHDPHARTRNVQGIREKLFDRGVRATALGSHRDPRLPPAVRPGRPES